MDLSIVREEWADYDLLSSDGIKIEVKSASFIQSWEQNKLSEIRFSIKKSKSINYSSSGETHIDHIRYADIYVFCLLKHTDQGSINPLETNQWDFYIVPTVILNNYQRSESSITLKSIIGKLRIEPTSYSNLHNDIRYKYIKHQVTHPITTP